LGPHHRRALDARADRNLREADVLTSPRSADLHTRLEYSPVTPSAGRREYQRSTPRATRPAKRLKAHGPKHSTTTES
jgi:hypothetical protein